MKKNFFFLSSYPHSAPGNRLNVFCQFRMLQFVGSPPPLGEGARDGCGRQPLRSGRAGGFAVGPALAIPQGLPTAPKGGAEGGFVGGYNRRCICCLRPIEIQPFRDS